MQIPDETGKIHERVFVQKSPKPLDLFFQRDQDKALLPFYLSLDEQLRHYDAGLVKHKPDVVKQTNEIFMNRTLNTPMLDMTINGENKKMSINNLLEIIQTLNSQLQQQRALAEQARQAHVQASSSADTNTNTIPVTIPGVNTPKFLTVDQVNELVDIQHAEIVKLTSRLSRSTQLDPTMFYLLDLEEASKK